MEEKQKKQVCDKSVEDEPTIFYLLIKYLQCCRTCPSDSSCHQGEKRNKWANAFSPSEAQTPSEVIEWFCCFRQTETAAVHGTASIQLPIYHNAINIRSFTSSPQSYYCSSISLAEQVPLLLQIISLIHKAFFFYNDEFGIYILGEETQSSC